jgi:S-adenosylmethionine hydrolase
MMPDPIITLTTDFGEASPYVAAMKGVILGITPAVRLVDLSHQIPPQDVRHADHFLAGAIPCFPGGVIHVVVVDPGVGSERSLLYVELGSHRLLLPDNGCWTALARKIGSVPVVRRLSEPRFWRQPVSNTFHGRDILAPTAAHLSLGTGPAQLGPRVAEWVILEQAAPAQSEFELTGEVVFIDDFGNLITNISEEMLSSWSDRDPVYRVGDQVALRRLSSYAAADPGQLVCLIGSSGMLEFAIVNGNAARQLQLSVGTVVSVAASQASSAKQGS